MSRSCALTQIHKIMTAKIGIKTEAKNQYSVHHELDANQSHMHLDRKISCSNHIPVKLLVFATVFNKNFHF